MSSLNTLLEMGFSRNKAEKALAVTDNQGVEAAMEWLLAHGDEMDVEETVQSLQTQATTDNSSGTSQTMDSFSKTLEMPEPQTDGAEKSPGSEMETHSGDRSTSPQSLEPSKIEATDDLANQPKSLKCDECGKVFRTPIEVEFHALKSGHQSFSESTEEIKPLTEEEKREQMRKLEEKIKQRRAEREEHERREAIEREKQRRRAGQDISQARQRFAEEEMRRAAEQRRREKLAEKLARQKILEEIERDKQARKKMFGVGGETEQPEPKPAAPAPITSSTPATSNKNYEECRLQIRLMNGQTLTQTFGSNEELAAVRLYIQLNRTDGSEPFSLMTNFPRKVFTDDDMSKPLSVLGLVPSAVLILTKPH